MIKSKGHRFLLVFTIGVFLIFSFQKGDEVYQVGLEKLKSSTLNFKNLTKFSMDVNYSVFANPQNFETPYKSDKGRIVRQGSNFYQEEMGNIVVANSKYILRINQKSKIISIENREGVNMLPINFNMDSLSNRFESIKVIPQGYEYRLKRGFVSKMDILYTSNNLIKLMRSYYSNQMDLGEGMVQVVTQLEYKNLSTSFDLPNDFFSLSKYVTISGGNVILKGKYTSYHILNNLK